MTKALKKITKHNFFDDKKIFILVTLGFLIINLLIGTTLYTSWKYTLELPIRTSFGTASYILNFCIGLGSAFAIYFYSNKKIRLEKLFLIIAIPMGILYCFLNPLGKVPDEDIHVRRAMAIASGNLFSHANEKGEASDEFDKKLDDLVNRDIYSYQDLKNRIGIEENGEKEQMGYTTLALYFPICHLPQVLGILIARLFNLNLVVQCYLGRLVNLFVSIAIIYYSIKYMPLKKEVLLFIALLPGVFNEIASLSSDALTISSILFFVSYVLYIKYDKKKIDKKDIMVLSISSVIIALCKIVYLPICFMLLILPKDVFKSSKQRKIVVSSIIAFSIICNLLWLLYSKRFIAEFNEGVNSGEQIKYILTSPIQYILILFRTINTYFEYYLFSLFGEGLGHFNLQASPIYVISSFLIMAFLILMNDEENKKKNVNLLTRIVSFGILLVVSVLIFTSIYITWNFVGSIRVEGVQGRYFLPLLIFIPFIVSNNKLMYHGKIDNRYLFLFSVFMNLNVLTITLYTYIYGMILNFYIK